MVGSSSVTFRYVLFLFNDTSTTEIYTLSLHDALPISVGRLRGRRPEAAAVLPRGRARAEPGGDPRAHLQQDRKSTRLNSSHGYISYAVFCLKKKKTVVKGVCVVCSPFITVAATLRGVV